MIAVMSSAIGGAQLGWDHAVGAFLWGIGGSLEGGQIAGSVTCAPTALNTCRNDYDFLATASSRGLFDEAIELRRLNQPPA